MGILGAGKVDAKTEIKKASEIILTSTEGFEAEKYRLGKTKVFFRAGALALLEEKRDDIVTLLIRKLQGQLRGHLRRKDYTKRKQQREYIQVVQRNFRKYVQSRDWPWFIIIQKTRPLIGMVNVEEELRLLEEEATVAWGHYQEQMNTKAKLQEENEAFSAEINALREKMRDEQGDLGLYQEKQAKVSAQKADLEVQLEENTTKLERLEREKASAGDGKKAVEREINNVRQDQADALAKVQKSRQDKEKLDTILRGLNEEVVHQDEIITKANKEKKHMTDTMSKATEEMNTNQEKLDYLNGVKAKLEKTLDQMDSAVEQEKRNKANSEKVEEMEEELEAERQGRAKAERQRSELANEYDELSERLEESGVATAAQIELNKKRDVEIGKMRKDVEENNIHHETTLLSLRKKHQDAVVEMSDQIDQLGKLKQKIEKDKMTVRLQLDDTRAATDHIFHEKAVADKNLKTLDSQIGTLQKKIDENLGQLCEYENQNKRFTSENANLFTRLEELAGNASILNKLKIQLNNQLDEAKRMADDEAKERQSLLGRFRTLEHEFDGVKIHFDDEVQQKEDVA